ncbi:MAG: hypothetical protein HYY44_00955 [Deltaproteobacteria bacterium]|nr:hypothetical protein [Deltaproteobacteria bacterium]MBI4374760.1 hypothetical protein [Deltaproteobacteria bacterium]
MRAFLFVAILLGALPLQAYGPRSVTSGGSAVKWDLPIRLDTESDLDVRGKDVTALIDAGLQAWVDVTEATVAYLRQDLGVAVDESNVCCTLYDSAACPGGPLDDGKNPIVVDDDGAVVAKFFGSGNRYATLGFAAVISFDSKTGKSVKGEAVLNAACLSGVALTDCGTLSFSDDDFTSFIVHEIGHFLGLNHAQVNLDEADDTDTSNDNMITTMYPFFIPGNGANFKTPEKDDKVGIAFLYPAGNFYSSTFGIKGTVYDTNGSTEFACANVIARNAVPSKARSDAVSFVSGQMCPGGGFDKSCDGNYEIYGLDPSASYQVFVEPINKDVKGASGIPPCEATGFQPTFTSQTRAGSLNAAAGNNASSIDFTLSGTSGNVNSLSLLPLDISEGDGPDRSLFEEAILKIEAKNAGEACSTSKVDSDGSAGCTLINKYL